MSSEKQPTPTPDQETQEMPNPGEVENQEQNTSENGDSENTASVLSPENKSFWRKMSEEGRKIANKVYEGLYEIPGVRRVVGKLEIAYNQFWIDRHQAGAVQSKEKIHSIDRRVGEFDQVKKRIDSTIERLRSRNFPGAESLQVKLQDIDRQNRGLLNERNQAQASFEARYNKLELYTNERDRVAGRLIERYEEKLKPMEEELEELSTLRDKTDLQIAVTEGEYKEKLAELGEIKKEKAEIEEIYRQLGATEEEIRELPIIEEFDKELADRRKKMRVEKEELARRKAEINKRIAEVDAKANSYRNKREEFVRVKEGRPIKIDVATRQSGVDFKSGGETQADLRDEVAHETGSASAGAEEESKTEEESGKDKERLQTAAFIGGWNTFLKETYKDDAKFIDVKDFFKETGLLRDRKLDFESFKNILGKYLKYRKLPVDQFSQSIDEFFEQKVKIKK